MKSHFLRPWTLAAFLLATGHNGYSAPNRPSHTAPPISAPSQQVLAQNSAQANTLEVPAALLTYQLALDQISAGRLAAARFLLEENIRRHGNRSEINLLLAYVLQREGRVAEARQRLEAISNASPVAAAYAQQMNSMGRGPTATRSNTNIQVNNAAPNTGKPNSSLAQTDARLAKLEQTIAGLVNAERQKAGLQPLSYNVRLADVSRAHSAEMRDLRYFGHESPTPSLKEPLDRYKAVFGGPPAVVAENVYRAWGTQHQLSDNDARAAHLALMNSPGHRENILFPGVTRIGVGIVANANGDLWITQMLEKP